MEFLVKKDLEVKKVVKVTQVSVKINQNSLKIKNL